MNQFKPIFLGQVDPQSSLATLTRAVNSQKCIRAGGKHNDLDDVGRDTYHHTFFEMLGSWSFGGQQQPNDDDVDGTNTGTKASTSTGAYFKQEAIQYAWELLTTVYHLDPSCLYATYFEGDTDSGMPADNEARDYWLQYLPPERVIACPARDNFWEMGETGPCGPCTEIHFDRLGGDNNNERNVAHLVNADDPNVIEIWNLVFIQYNRESATKLSPLPAQHVDTGMGLERLVSILQDKKSNYDIDCFQPLFAKLAEHSTVGVYTGRVDGDDQDDTHHNSNDSNNDNENENGSVVHSSQSSSSSSMILKDTAYRAIADHARTLCFAIADGAVPNNEGRGYVLRRILRRATRYGQQILGAQPGFFVTLVPVVVETFGAAYPELVQSQTQIMEIIQEEEQAFSTMLDRGIKYFAELEQELKKDKQSEVPGDKAFFLYDTLGFPIDLTEQMAAEAGLSVDTVGFTNAMAEQKERSRVAQRAARSGGANPSLELIAEHTSALSERNVLATDDGFKYKWDVQLPATVMAIFTNGGFLDNDTLAKQDDFVGLVLDKSSFYAEAGGQETDIGRIEFLDAAGAVTGIFAVTDVQVYGGFILHKGVVEDGEINVGDHVNCKVNYDRRRFIAPNHSMTHVLNAALRQVLGDGVEQRGSLCNEEKLRFDFSYKKAMTTVELQQVEEICQSVVSDSQDVTSEMMALDDAKKIKGVRAVFGEVYPDPVRVIRVGDDTSVEFCGGTHISNTIEAEAFVLVEETAVAKGIRRISAVTKEAARTAMLIGEKFSTLIENAETLDPEMTLDLEKQAGALRKNLDASFISAPLKAGLRARVEGIQKKSSEAAKKAVQKRVDNVLNEVKQSVHASIAADEQVLVLRVDIGADSKASQTIANAVKDLAPGLPFLGISEEEPGTGGKVMAFAVVPEPLIVASGFQADEWVVAALASCGGRGGGRPGNAQAQATLCDDLPALFDAAKAFAISKLKDEVL